MSEPLHEVRSDGGSAANAEHPGSTTRQKVERLEASMRVLEQAHCPVRHYVAPGLYAREITIPRGVVLTGAVHRTENLAVLSKGRLDLVVDGGTVTIEAPCTLTVKPGAKNAALALEDAVWTNFFPTTETDPEKLVELLTFSKASELLGGKDNAQLIEHAKTHSLEA